MFKFQKQFKKTKDLAFLDGMHVARHLSWQSFHLSHYHISPLTIGAKNTVHDPEACYLHCNS